MQHSSFIVTITRIRITACPLVHRTSEFRTCAGKGKKTKSFSVYKSSRKTFAESSVLICQRNFTQKRGVMFREGGVGVLKSTPNNPLPPAVVITCRPVRTRRMGAFVSRRPIGASGALYHGEIKVVVRAHECARRAADEPAAAARRRRGGEPDARATTGRDVSGRALLQFKSHLKKNNNNNKKKKQTHAVNIVILWRQDASSPEVALLLWMRPAPRTDSAACFCVVHVL